MIDKKTTVDQIEITRSGTIQVRLALELIENGEVLSHKLHRTLIAPGSDVAAQMAAVNVHLVQMNMNTVSDADVGQISALATVAWTPAVLAAYQAQQALVAELQPVL